MKQLLPTLLLLGAALAQAAIPCPPEPDGTRALASDSLLLLMQCQPEAGDSITERLRQLLDAGASTEVSDEQGRQPLHLALARLHEGPDWQAAALLLLGRGAPANAADHNGITPLQLASAETDGLVTAELLAQGADPLQADNNGDHALHHALRHTGNRATFAALLYSTGADLEEEERELLVERLIQQQRVDLLDALLEYIPHQTLDPIDASRALATLLWQGADVDCAERFLAAGAEPALVHSQGGGDLAWRLATLAHTEQLDWLLAQGYPLNELPASGFPPLFFASLAATRILLQRGADPNLASREHGTVAAAFIDPPAPFNDGGERLDRERLALLLAAGLAPDRRDHQGLTALQRALDADQLWLVQALLNAGADPTKTTNGERSLLPLALSRGRLPTVQALIRALPDVHERHPLLLLDYVGTEAPDPALVEALLVAGAAPDLTGAEGESALLRAARLQRWPLVKLMLNYGANPELSNAQGCTLHCYSWSMPDEIRLALPGQKPPGWQWPAIQRTPAAFFALALSPMLALWLITVGVALARYRPLWPDLLWLGASLAITVVLGASLFFDCDPCLIRDHRTQSWLLMVVATLIYAIGPLRRWRQTRLAQP